jgi:hypothetical protein
MAPNDQANNRRLDANTDLALQEPVNQPDLDLEKDEDEDNRNLVYVQVIL